MQPRTTLKYDSLGLQKMQRKLQSIRECAREREVDATYAREFPDEIGLKLTNRCNLRCTHCFQWDIGGYHHSLDKSALKKEGDLRIEVVRELFEKTKAQQSSLYLWGGEPTLYAHWDELIELLKEDPRDTVMCTNAVNLQHQMESLISISECLNILISIEGPEDIHDKIRGKNTYGKILENLETLLARQQKGEYKGTISVEAVISDGLIPQLYDFCEYYEKKGINSLFLNFPWFIPDHVADEMDAFFAEKYHWMNTDRGKGNSWHSFDFKISQEMIPELKVQIEKIMNKTWDIRIRFHPDLREDLVDYIEGATKPAQRKTRCLGISNRIDLLPSGQVTPCKKFTEFIVGDLNNQSLEDVWNGPDYKRFREVHNNELMSICSKCEILYANGI
ncbi:radical SAM/SPASM domain-containing protein [Chitinophaga nivalis]|uniref:Radical SAM protein n=1 Tax=Chitinophaga nivalis TaxID=2991709 RepID=A0ABT3IM00_9BACT|nr:radical SAM protein [Chitinophaga nivalis]MCW3465317.1 radical SAM protein [Chitinophaga nivalis]MCW3484991.1 radical SAM protein [Chitinophaga nivalis]